ncbi:MAG: hypothetical protein AAFR11_13095 [Pseudomonadota bacterium]
MRELNDQEKAVLRRALSELLKAGSGVRPADLPRALRMRLGEAVAGDTDLQSYIDEVRRETERKTR